MGTLNEMFDPDRVAVVGATSREGAVGRAVTSNLLDDFDGDTVPVNPNYDEVLGRPLSSTRWPTRTLTSP